MARALASHRCGSGSILRPGVICGLSKLVVGSRPCSERFFSGYSGFRLSSKTNISKSQFDLESVPNKRSAIYFVFAWLFGVIPSDIISQ